MKEYSKSTEEGLKMPKDHDLEDKYFFRQYQAGDFKGISELWDRTDMGSPERGDDENTIEETIRIGGCMLLMVNKDSGSICGSSWMTFDGRRILLHHFGVLPECQGKGLSKMLLSKSLEIVKEKGKQVKLEVHSQNFKAINLYKNFGFVHLGEYNVYIIRDTSKL
jgi:ribosomal protein S18 acetylase RimI-like enzyme